MKKYYFLLFMLCFMPFYGLFAQIQKGGQFISGSINFSKSKAQFDGTNTTPFQNSGGQFGTSVGYSKMVTNNWAIGAAGYYATSKSANDIVYSNNGTIDRVTLKLKQQYANVSGHAICFYPLGETGKWLFALNGGLSYGFGVNQTDSVRTTGTKNVQSPRSQSVNLSFSPSIVFAFSKHVFAQAYLGNLSLGHSWTTAYKNTSADLSIYPSWGSFGFLYYW